MSTTSTTPAALRRHDPAAAARGRRPSLGAGLGVRLAGQSSALLHAGLALLAYLPLLLARPGVVTDDTKTYLYLDPARFLRQVPLMWNPDVALGTVTHENIGYLLPMGPFFWICSVLHLPIWVAQRLWLGSILFAAGAGVLYLCRTLRLSGPGTAVAALAFMLSPYFLQYAGRISVILLPWAGLPWMVALVAKAVRHRGWRYPALFALVVALVSGINASSVLYAGLAPVLWLVYAVAVEREARWRDAFAVAGKVAALSLVVCLWWIVGLQIEAAYGVNVLKYTETISATSQTSTASEVLRGIGYWYFYGGDRDGPWTFSSVVYTQWLWVIVSSFALVALGFLSAILVRWRHRAYFVALVVLGVVLSVGAHPFNSPTPFGGVLKSFMADTTAGLAMRSTDRATPLVVLGSAMLLGAGVTALWRRISWAGVLSAVGLAALVVANNPALFNGDTIANGMTQPASQPGYEQQAANHLNSVNPGLRVLGIPGDDFAVYNWGDTVDTPQVALLQRPYAIQEQQIMGSMPTADMLYAIDAPIQQGTEQWSTLAPMARLISAGDVLVQSDTAYWRYGIPQPQTLWDQLQPTPPGLSHPVSFGAPRQDVAPFSTLNEQDLAADPNANPPPPLVSYSVSSPRPIVRGESTGGALVVSGDATGLENLAATGMLDTTSPIYYSGTLDPRPSQLKSVLNGGAQLVVTDTNRKQAVRWDGLVANTGYTETPLDHPQRSDPSDSPLDLFPDAPASAKTTAFFSGAVDVTASTYGDQVSYLPENRAYAAVDSNPDTAWETGTFVPNPAGQWWQIRLPHAVTTDQLRLTQPLRGNLERWLTKVKLTFDGGRPVTVDLRHSSRTSAGQVVHFPRRTFTTLRITFERTSDDQSSTLSAGPVGFSQVSIPGVAVSEAIAMPTDLTQRAGPASLSHRLTYLMTRERVSPFPVRTDPETQMVRVFSVPTARTFTLSGTASISALVPDDAIDRLVGRPGSDGSGVVAYSSGRLPGDLQAGASAAIDGNPSTVWEPGFGASHQVGAWLHYDLPSPITLDHMNLQVVADGRHSVPTELKVSTENGSRTVKLPPIPDSRVPGAVTTVPVSFPALSGSHIVVTFKKVRLERATNYDAPSGVDLPLGIAELGVPGLTAASDPTQLPATCQSDLVDLDGHPLDVSVVGTTAAARNESEMTLKPCGADANGITLAAGSHLLTTAVGHNVGWDVDQLALDSAPGGGAEPASSPSTLAAPTPGPSPTVRVTSQGATSLSAKVTGATKPFELVLGQSVNPGWRVVATPGPGARPGAHPVNLGTSELVDGFANGWPVSAAQLAALGGSSFIVQMTWTPQTHEWIALAISGAGIVLCLLLAYLPWRWRRSLGRRGRALGARAGAALRRLTRSGRPSRGGSHRRRRTATPGVGEPAGENAGAAVASRAGRSLVSAGVPGPSNGRSDGPGPSNGRSDGLGARPGGRRVEGDGRPGAAGRDPAGAGQPESARATWTAEPRLAAPWELRGRRPPVIAAVAIAVVTGIVAWLISYPLVGVVATLCVGAALLWRPARTVLTAAALGLVVAAGATVVVGQVQNHLTESSNWPQSYEGAGILALAAVVLLGADAVVEVARRVAGRRRSSPDSEG